MVSKEKIVKGARTFAEQEILPPMKADGAVYAVVKTAIQYALTNTALVDKFFSQYQLEMGYDASSGDYEILTILALLEGNLKETAASISVTIPLPPLFFREEKTITLHAGDINKLISCIKEA